MMYIEDKDATNRIDFIDSRYWSVPAERRQWRGWKWLKRVLGLLPERRHGQA